MEEGRVHFENQPLRNAAILESLDQVEDVNISGKGWNRNATPCKQFLHLVGSIHAELAKHAHLVQDYRSYGRSTYGVEKDAELARTNVKLILSQLRDLRRFTDEHYAE
ncbi:hypothetical protein Ae201684P_008291 [Aphanomyces euteiches]|nr:hypothetical protein Ae201684P_008291 [Aphanomyces euteiches]